MPEPIDSLPSVGSSSESSEVILPFGERQANVGKAWADIYSNSNIPLNNSAEIALRNPAVYSRGVEKLGLPDDVRNKWSELSVFADSLATIAATKPIEWGTIKGLDKLQQLVFAGNVRPDFRRSVGDMIKASSDLFAESVKIAPGDEKYFTGNVMGAEGWLKRASQQLPSQAA